MGRKLKNLQAEILDFLHWKTRLQKALWKGARDMNIKEYRQVESLEEAWELNQKKNNRTSAVCSGWRWISGRFRQRLICPDRLNQIEETEDEFRIGCYDITSCPGESRELNIYTNGAMKEALKIHRGVQFQILLRWTKHLRKIWFFGCSDHVFGYGQLRSCIKAGWFLAEYAKNALWQWYLSSADREKQKDVSFSYQSVRNSRTDFPVLTLAASLRQKMPPNLLLEQDRRAVLVSTAVRWSREQTYGKCRVP